MADRPKRTLRPLMRLAEEYCISPPYRRKKTRKDNKLYEVEVKEVDRERNMVRIHYKGYSDKFDEWRPYGSEEESYFPFVRQEKMPLPSENSLEERSDLFKHKLYTEIKRKLYSCKRDDPDVRIEVDVSEDVFTHVLGNLVGSVMERGKAVYKLNSNRVLDEILGLKWDDRIFNSNGDFAYVIEKTTKFWLGKKSPVVEYKVLGNGKYIRSEIEDTSQAVFTFVRGDGNRLQYEQRH